jgi:anaerobic magnesium-protoporphyrin IX monomethyl ester cyclase
VRVTLVIPPSGFLLDDRVFPALGVLKVAAALEASGVDVDVLDLCGVVDASDPLAAHLESHRSDVYGFTATMPQMPVAAALAAQVRATRPHARLVLGGPHVTLMRASARQELKRGEPSRACQAMAELAQRFDVLVCGDGELAIHSALMAYPPSLIDADDPASDLFLKPSDLNDGPFAARHLIDLDSYHYAVDGKRAQSLIGQLGCPFGCAFCGGRSSPFLRRVRTRSTARVIAEMRHIYEVYGTEGFFFLDDELNVNKLFPDLLAQMIELQHELGAEFRMRGFLKAELVTPQMAEMMYLAGFRQVLVGFESAHPRILQNIRKVATREDNTRAAHRLQAAGIKVKALMSVGHAGESAETIEATRQWLLDVQPSDFDVTIITVYPGTPYYDDARETQPGVYTYTDRKTGDRLHGVNVDHLADANFYKGVPGSYRSFVYTDHLSAEDLCGLRDDVEADVRAQLAIPYPQAFSAMNYEHSMGMSA